MKQQQFFRCPDCGTVYLTEAVNAALCPDCYKLAIIGEEVEPLPALSIKQPWAWLIINGYKDIENRNNLKNFKGEFLIHTGEKFDKKWWNSSQCEFMDDPMLSNNQFDYGGIIGHATITGFVEKSDSPWFVGKYGLIIKDPKPLPFTPCKGKLSFFKPEILTQ